VSILDDLPQRLTEMEKKKPAGWYDAGGCFLLTDTVERVGFLLSPYRNRVLRKMLDAELIIYYDGRTVRKYSGTVVNELYDQVWCNQYPPNTDRKSAFEDAAVSALERTLSTKE
jgi:hypothetical protein